MNVNHGQWNGSRAKQLTLSKVETLRESHDLSAKSKRLWYRVSDRFCKNIIYRLRKAHIEQSSNLPILVHHFESHGAPPLSKQVSHQVTKECKSCWEIEPLSSWQQEFTLVLGLTWMTFSASSRLVATTCIPLKNLIETWYLADVAIFHPAGHQDIRAHFIYKDVNNGQRHGSRAKTITFE